MSGSSMSSATDPGERSAAEIEREVEATRARLTGTLEELREKTSPGQLFEQAVDYFRSSGGTEFARNLGASVRDNPLPLLLIGAGIGWLMLSGGGPRPGDRDRYATDPYPALPPPSPRERPMARIYGEPATYGGTQASSGIGGASYGSSGGPSMTERASEAMGSAGRSVGDAASGLRDSVSGAAQRAGDMASSAYESVTETAGSAARRVGDAASSAYESVTDAASSAARRVGDLASSAYESVTGTAASAGYRMRDGAGYVGDNAREGLGWVMREQPLVLGAIGLALGAAVGALLPGTETEDRLMGETRDELAERATAMAQEGYERVREVAGEHLERAQERAGEAYESTKQRLDEGGLSVSRAGSALGEAAREVREAVREVAQEVGGQARSAIGGGDDAARSSSTEPQRPGETRTAGGTASTGTGTADPVTNPQPSPRQSNPL